MNSTIPADLLELSARFETWRANRKYVREPIPDELWNAAGVGSGIAEASAATDRGRSTGIAGHDVLRVQRIPLARRLDTPKTVSSRRAKGIRTGREDAVVDKRIQRKPGEHCYCCPLTRLLEPRFPHLTEASR